MHYIVRLRARHLVPLAYFPKRELDRKQEGIECPDCWITKTQREKVIGALNTTLG